MPEFRSPLARTDRARQFGSGADGEPLVSLSECTVGSAFQVSGWDPGFEASALALMRRLGFSGTGAFGAVQTAGTTRAYRLAPTRVLVVSDSALTLPGYDDAKLVRLDLSHARVAIRVAGPRAVTMLQCCASLDFSTRAFAPNRFALTGIHEIPVLIDRTGATSFVLYVPYTWTRSLWGTLTRTAAALEPEAA